MEKKFNYVYITTNLLNGKQYVGDHSTDNLNDNYLGSGIYFDNAFKKYKRKNFNCQILEYFKTKKEAFDAQEKWINKYQTLSPNGYNLSPKGGYGVANSYLSEDTKEKIRQKNIFYIGEKSSCFKKLTDEQINEIINLYLNEHYSITQIHKKLHLNYYKIKNVLLLYNVEIFKKPSIKKGKTYEEIYGIEIAKILKQNKSNAQLGNKNHNFGKHFSEETKQKMSNAAKIKPSEKTSMFGKHFTEKHKQKIRESVKKYWANKKALKNI